MSSLDGTIVATGLPTLHHALHASINWTVWTMTGYQLGLVVAFPIAGRVADSLGRKRVFVAAAVLFTTSSLLCGLALNIGMLIGLRVTAGGRGAAFMPSASGMVMDAFGEHRQRALGLFSSIFPLGALVGPIVGGIILATWSWRGLFLVNVPIGLTFTLLAWRFLPSSQRSRRPARFPRCAAPGRWCPGADAGHHGRRQLHSRVLLRPLALSRLLFSIVCGWAFRAPLRRAGKPSSPCTC